MSGNPERQVLRYDLHQAVVHASVPIGAPVCFRIRLQAPNKAALRTFDFLQASMLGRADGTFLLQKPLRSLLIFEAAYTNQPLCMFRSTWIVSRSIYAQFARA